MIAIALALITKEVYSSLFIGILAGGLLYSNFSFDARAMAITGGSRDHALLKKGLGEVM